MKYEARRSTIKVINSRNVMYGLHDVDSALLALLMFVYF